MTRNDPNFNAERHRYYGLRKGDIISSRMYKIEKAKVIDYGFMDNNSVVVKEPGQKARSVVAEWCTIVTKIEDQ